MVSRIAAKQAASEGMDCNGGDRNPLGQSLKYLGLVLDGRLNFEVHFRQLAPRVEKIALSLERILPNIGGRRKAYGAFIQQ